MCDGGAHQQTERISKFQQCNITMVDMYSPPPTAQKTCDDFGTLTARAGVAGRNKESTNPEIPSSLCLPLDSRDERNMSSRMEHQDKSLIEGSSPQNYGSITYRVGAAGDYSCV